MRLKRCGGERSYWQADDEAGLWFKDGWEKAEPPETVEAHLVGHSGLVRAATREIDLARLDYVAKAFFGAPRGPEGRKWTADYLKYALYTLRAEYGPPEAVIMRADGGGTYFYVVDELDSAHTFTEMARLLPEPLLWSLLNSYAHTYDQGLRNGRDAAYRLFLEGRLKKRRKDNRVRVEVLPAPKA